MELINVGSSPNSRDGDSLRQAFQKTNNNFEELYDIITEGVAVISSESITQALPPDTSLGAPGDVAGNVAADETYFYYCITTYDGSTHIWRRVAWNVEVW